jgi:hypothetical protein
VRHACYPSTQEVEAGGWRVRGQLRLNSETVSTTTKFLDTGVKVGFPGGFTLRVCGHYQAGTSLN